MAKHLERVLGLPLLLVLLWLSGCESAPPYLKDTPGYTWAKRSAGRPGQTTGARTRAVDFRELPPELSARENTLIDMAVGHGPYDTFEIPFVVVHSDFGWFEYADGIVLPIRNVLDRTGDREDRTALYVLDSKSNTLYVQSGMTFTLEPALEERLDLSTELSGRSPLKVHTITEQTDGGVMAGEYFIPSRNLYLWIDAVAYEANTDVKRKHQRYYLECRFLGSYRRLWQDYPDSVFGTIQIRYLQAPPEELAQYDAFYDAQGYCYVDGYNREGYDREGFDREGYDRLGYNREGYDEKGYNRFGYAKDGTDREGNRYTGEFTETGKNGFGELRWSSGATYRGTFSDDEIQGVGVMFGPDGTAYAGRWTEGRKDGPGVHIGKDGPAERQVWEAGELVRRQNAPRIVEESGDWVFLGEDSRQGLAHGSGEAIEMVSGRVVSPGRFDRGRLVEGRMWTPDGLLLTGEFREGKLVRGRVVSAEGWAYEGVLRDNLPQGQGTLRNADGTRYEGGFSSGRYAGHGKLALPNGDVYEGPFSAGLPHGAGIYKNASEDTVESCEFYEGRRVDQLYLTRIARAEAEAKRKAEEERRARQAAEQERLEEERRKAAEEAAARAESRKRWAAIGAGALTFGLGQSMGLGTEDSLALGAALTQDIIEGTGTQHLDETREMIVGGHRVEQWEQQYGIRDLSGVAGHGTAVSRGLVPGAPVSPSTPPGEGVAGGAKGAAPAQGASRRGFGFTDSGEASGPSATPARDVSREFSAVGRAVGFDYCSPSREEAVSIAKSLALRALNDKVEGAGGGLYFSASEVIYGSPRTWRVEKGACNGNWEAEVTATVRAHN